MYEDLTLHLRDGEEKVAASEPLEGEEMWFASKVVYAQWGS
jgi:hypothetical protein